MKSANSWNMSYISVIFAQFYIRKIATLISHKLHLKYSFEPNLKQIRTWLNFFCPNMTNLWLYTCGPRNMPSFYLRFCVYAIQNWRPKLVICDYFHLFPLIYAFFPRPKLVICDYLHLFPRINAVFPELCHSKLSKLIKIQTNKQTKIIIINPNQRSFENK